VLASYSREGVWFAHLLRDGAGELGAVCSVWSVGVDGNDKVGKLPVNERAQGRQAEDKG